jgi:zinc protease
VVEAKSFPPALARAALKREVFPADPYGYVATPETVGHITRIDMERFYGTYYDASDTVVTLVGDINRAGASAIAHQLTADLPVGRRPLTALPHAAAGESTSKGSYKAAASWSNVQHIVLPGDEAYVLMGQPGVAIDDPDYFPLLVGNYILGGGGFRSWLTRELRERRGLTYGVISEFLTQRKGGMFVIMFETRPDEAAESIRIARSTVVDIVNRGPTDAEIEQAKANLIGNFSTRVSSNEQLLANAALIGVYDLPLDWMDRWTDRVNAVSASAVRQALRARLSTQKMVTIEVGPKN